MTVRTPHARHARRPCPQPIHRPTSSSASGTLPMEVPLKVPVEEPVKVPVERQLDALERDIASPTLPTSNSPKPSIYSYIQILY